MLEDPAALRRDRRQLDPLAPLKPAEEEVVREQLLRLDGLDHESGEHDLAEPRDSKRALPLVRTEWDELWFKPHQRRNVTGRDALIRRGGGECMVSVTSS